MQTYHPKLVAFSIIYPLVQNLESDSSLPCYNNFKPCSYLLQFIYIYAQSTSHYCSTSMLLLLIFVIKQEFIHIPDCCVFSYIRTHTYICKLIYYFYRSILESLGPCLLSSSLRFMATLFYYIIKLHVTDFCPHIRIP